MATLARSSKIMHAIATYDSLSFKSPVLLIPYLYLCTYIPVYQIPFPKLPYCHKKAGVDFHKPSSKVDKRETRKEGVHLTSKDAKNLSHSGKLLNSTLNRRNHCCCCSAGRVLSLLSRHTVHRC